MSADSYPALLVSGAASGYRMIRVIGVALVYKYYLTGLSVTRLHRRKIFSGVFGTLSIYGTTQAIPFDEAFINFKGLSPMIAGLLRSPYLEILQD